MPHDDAVRIILDGKGRHFDPDVVDAFFELQAVFRNIALTYADFDEEREMLGSGMPCAEPSGKGITHVLLVEDNEINLEIMKNQLASLRFTVVTAAKPPAPIEKGLAGPGLLAHVAVSKYGDHLPLHPT